MPCDSLLLLPSKITLLYLVRLALGRLVDWQSLKPALRNVGTAEDLVDDLPNVVDKDKLDARLDTLRHVLVDIRLARGGNDEL